MDDRARHRLISLLGMLGSAHDGEVLNAAKMAQRQLGSMNTTWEELLDGFGGQKNRLEFAFQEGYNAGFTKGLAEGSTKLKFQPVQTWHQFAQQLRGNEDKLTQWEIGFLDSWIERDWPTPTPKQRLVFERIAHKMGLDCPDDDEY